MTIGSYEAKTRLSALLERVSRGEQITITRHGVPIAKLVPVNGANKNRDSVAAAVAALKGFRKGNKLGRLSLRTLIQEGRR